MRKRYPRIRSAEAWNPVRRATARALRVAAIAGTAAFGIFAVTYSARPWISSVGIAGGGVLFAGGLPGLLAYRRIQQRRATRSEGLFLVDDRLAEVADRQWLFDKAKAAEAWTTRKDGQLGVLLLDPGSWKDQNGNLAIHTRDEMLQAFARRLKAALRPEDTMARLTGEQFAILQVGSAQPQGAKSLATRLLKKISEPYTVGDRRVLCEPSIGVAVAPTDAWEWETLLDCAETALYQSKAAGAKNVCFFEEGMDADFRKRRKLESELRRALDSQKFQLAFQPLFHIGDGKLVGFEALLRWPAGWERYAPAAFIPVAEESGLIVPIGAWVLETACAWAAAWTEPLRLSVNVSPVQFAEGSIVAAVDKALKRSGLDPARLELEVTESLWVQNSDSVLAQLSQLRAMGIAIVLDDFGTGFSILSCLWKFPFDAVKIDRSFVSEMNLDPKAGAIVRTIVALGKNLKITVTAEGVETRAQANALIAAGCDRAQGYLYGRPLSATSPVL